MVNGLILTKKIKISWSYLMTKHFANDFHEGRMPYDDEKIIN